jgi:hypothetical protein
MSFENKKLKYNCAGFNINKIKMDTKTETTKLAMRKYQNDYYERNKEQLREMKLISYYKRQYGLDFLTKENFESFKENKKIYLELLDNDNVLNKEIVMAIIKLKYEKKEEQIN